MEITSYVSSSNGDCSVTYSIWRDEVTNVSVGSVPAVPGGDSADRNDCQHNLGLTSRRGFTQIGRLVTSA